MKGILLIRFFTVREEKLLRILVPDGVLRLRALAAAGKSSKFGLSLEPPLFMDFERAGSRLIEYTVLDSFNGIKSNPFVYFLFWTQAALTSVLFPEGAGEVPFEEFLAFLFFLENLSGEKSNFQDDGVRSREEFKRCVIAKTTKFMLHLLKTSGWLSDKSYDEVMRKAGRGNITHGQFLKIYEKVLFKLGLDYPVQKIEEFWETFSRWE